MDNLMNSVGQGSVKLTLPPKLAPLVDAMNTCIIVAVKTPTCKKRLVDR